MGDIKGRRGKEEQFVIAALLANRRKNLNLPVKSIILRSYFSVQKCVTLVVMGT